MCTYIPLNMGSPKGCPTHMYVYLYMYMCVVRIHISVACELIKDLVVYEEVQHPLMTGLINLLKPAEKEEKEGDSSRQTSSGEVEQASSDHVIEQLCAVSLPPS